MDWTKPLADIDGLAAWVAKDSPQRAASAIAKRDLFNFSRAALTFFSMSRK